MYKDTSNVDMVRGENDDIHNRNISLKFNILLLQFCSNSERKYTKKKKLRYLELLQLDFSV